jgi:hypothetical protein
MATQRRFKKSDVGRWVRVRWNDVGVRDELVVDVENDGRTARTLEAGGDQTNHAEHDQVVTFGPCVVVPVF